MLPDSVRIRLIQLLGMMGSVHEGERLNAATMAQALITSHKLTWTDVIREESNAPARDSKAANRAAGVGAGREGWAAEYERGKRDGREEMRLEILAEYDLERKSDEVRERMRQWRAATRPPSWRGWAQQMVDEEEDALSEWEVSFFGSFAAGKYHTPTARQRAIFERVAERLDRELPE